MSAELLREAASLMRARAEAAPHAAAWIGTESEGGNRDARRTLGTFTLIHDTKSEVALVRGFSGERSSCAEHIAGMDPTVAFAVAALLDHAATHQVAFTPNVRPLLVAVATAYLGSS